MKSNQPASVTYLSCVATDLTNATPNTASGTPAPFSGAISGHSSNAGASYLINFKIGNRYRGGHPRIYIPGVPPVATADGETIQSPYNTGVLNAWTAAMNAMHSALGSGTGNHVVPRYTYQYTADPVHHKYTKQRTALSAVYVVQSYSLNPRIATQRRRLQT
jgi:hypothetical protein